LVINNQIDVKIRRFNYLGYESPRDVNKISATNSVDSRELEEPS
jgi:hypothetical protein